MSRDILIQGRIYVGQRHVCFYANIIGWVTSVVLPFRDIISVEKKSTAMIFPNAIQISTMQNRYFFTSFITRENAYQALHDAWQVHLLSSLPDSIKGHQGIVNEMIQKNKRVSIGEDLFSDDLLMIESGDHFIAESSDGPPIFPTYHSSDLVGPNGRVPAVTNSPTEFSKDKKTNIEIERQLAMVNRCQCDFHRCYLIAIEEFPGCSPEQVDKIVFSMEPADFSFLEGFLASRSINLRVRDEGGKCSKIRVTNEGGGKLKRQYDVSLPLPYLSMTGQNIVDASIEETRVFERTGKSYVLECHIKMLGVPGGNCSIHTRICISYGGSTDIGTFLLVTGDVDPPPHAWLKDSIHEFLLSYAASHYRELLMHIKSRLLVGHGGSICALSKESIDQFPVQLLDSWKRSRADEYSSREINIYFDSGAFFRSLIRMSPVLIVLVAIFLILIGGQYTRGPKFGPGQDPLEAADRMQYIEGVYRDLRSFLYSQRDSHTEINEKYHDIIGRMQEQIDSLDEKRTPTLL